MCSYWQGTQFLTTLMKRFYSFPLITALILGFLLMNSIFAPPALAGRYVLNQSPQTIQSYFGLPIGQPERRRDEKGNTVMTYNYSLSGIRKVFPKFPKQGRFYISFINNRAQTIGLEPNASETESFDYSQAAATKFYNYIFGYRPPIWKEYPNFYGGGHEGFGESKYCLGDGVVNYFVEYRLGMMISTLSYNPVCEPPYNKL